jgi:arylsulfatase A-like enzyme
MKKNNYINNFFILFFAFFYSIPSNAQRFDIEKIDKLNVLFIAVDDLNHWVRYLGRNKQVITPNIDRLAKMGMAFSNAYAAAPVCSPSRTALMSGLRPSTTGVYSNKTDWRPRISIDKPLTTQFRKAGYQVTGAGKIYHGRYNRIDEWDDYGNGKGKFDSLRCPRIGENRSVTKIKWAIGDCSDDGLGDYQTAQYAIDELKKKHDQPFFLAAGIFRPHMPWIVPKKYFDKYPLEEIDLPPYLEDDLADVPEEGIRLAKPKLHDRIVKAGRWIEAIQAYLASITYADAMIGRILDAYDKSPDKDNTMIVLFGDHGWHLGEKHHWRKFTLWEEATRVPLIWYVPEITKPNTTSERTVDLMSIYPTLMELCGLPIPSHVEGTSIKILLENPDVEWTIPALTTYGFGNHAIRTEKWRYIRYKDGGEELYDETADPYEWKNLASDSNFQGIKTDMAKYFPKINKPTLLIPSMGNGIPAILNTVP